MGSLSPSTLEGTFFSVKVTVPGKCKFCCLHAGVGVGEILVSVILPFIPKKAKYLPKKRTTYPEKTMALWKAKKQLQLVKRMDFLLTVLRQRYNIHTNHRKKHCTDMAAWMEGGLGRGQVMYAWLSPYLFT